MLAVAPDALEVLAKIASSDPDGPAHCPFCGCPAVAVDGVYLSRSKAHESFDGAADDCAWVAARAVLKKAGKLP